MVFLQKKPFYGLIELLEIWMLRLAEERLTTRNNITTNARFYRLIKGGEIGDYSSAAELLNEDRIRCSTGGRFSRDWLGQRHI